MMKSATNFLNTHYITKSKFIAFPDYIGDRWTYKYMLNFDPKMCKSHLWSNKAQINHFTQNSRKSACYILFPSKTLCYTHWSNDSVVILPQYCSFQNILALALAAILRQYCHRICYFWQKIHIAAILLQYCSNILILLREATCSSSRACYLWRRLSGSHNSEFCIECMFTVSLLKQRWVSEKLKLVFIQCTLIPGHDKDTVRIYY